MSAGRISIEVVTNKALIAGQVLKTLPADLYIPSDALHVILANFEGPLDVLLYVIKKNNVDILDISVSDVTRQYVKYVELMRVLRLELIAEYLEMITVLVEIKSKMLLPRPKLNDELVVNPKVELLRRLQNYELIKTAAEVLNELPRVGRELFSANVALSYLDIPKVHIDVGLKELLLAFKNVLKRIDWQVVHSVEHETLSVRERMSKIVAKLKGDKCLNFIQLCSANEGRVGVVVTFMAILSMVKESVVELVQSESFAIIYVKAIC